MTRRYQYGSVGLVVLFVIASLGSAQAKRAHSNWVPLAKIDKSLRSLNDSYGDILSSVNCRKTSNTVGKLICDSDYLSRAELLNTRAAAYAEENATKSEVDHKRFLGSLPKQCKTDECIYKYFSEETNKSLGGDFPYAE